MNHKYLLLLSIIPVIFTVYLYDNVSASDQMNTQGSMNLGAGHFEVTIKDSMGVTKSYSQSDNAVVNPGENCVAKMMFRHPTNAGTVVCVGATNAAWNYICLDENPTVYYTDTEIKDVPEMSGLAACQQATITWNQNSTGSTSALSKVTLRLSYTFTNSDVSSETIYAAGIFNSSTVSTNSMLSRANFTGTAVPPLSTLTVNYDYEVGGGTVP